ncbi:MAG: DEAD/DEAH box helicase family protein [Cellulomonadaceae bacterium]|jgi:hypothetical protein|nr:DEAD/DEAH box helicase family protein [Cellulomonadaceae bacterium]
MKYELFEYQEAAVNALTKSLVRSARDHEEDPSERSAIVLSAPTGSGKTIIATGVVEASLDESPTTPGIDNATFLWVTDDPSLNRQTLAKMMDSASDMDLSRMMVIENDFDAETFDPGFIYFLNIQKLGVKATLSRSREDGRHYSLWETIANTVDQRPGQFVVVVDEAHRGTSPTASSSRQRDTIVNQIIGGGVTNRPAAPLVWGISATPRRFLAGMSALGRTTRQHSVKVEDVRASGLLKDQIVLGHTQGVNAAESALVRFAVERIRNYDRKWAEYTTATGAPDVKPVLVIQVADKPSPLELGTLLSTVLEEWPSLRPENIVHTFAEHGLVDAHSWKIPWCPPEDIQDRLDVRVVLCKTAITTGWDCPRAEVLLSLRVAKDLDVITQVMGRMVRTPLARRINTDQDLNAVHCILPHFDADAVTAIADRFRLGDEETLAGGTAIILDAVELSRNSVLLEFQTERARTLGPAASHSAPVHHATSADTPTEPMPTSSGQPFILAEPIHYSEPGVSALGNAVTTPSRLGTPVATLASGSDDETIFDAHATALASLTKTSADDIFRLIESLPSYTIPQRSTRSQVERLYKFAMELAGPSGSPPIDHQAPAKAKTALRSVIDERRQLWIEDGTLPDRVDKAGQTKLYERKIAFADPDSPSLPERSSTLVLDSRGVQILLSRSGKCMPQGLVNTYIHWLVNSGGLDLRTAQLTTLAVSGDPSLANDINSRAATIIAKWFRDYGGAISRLPDQAQEPFDRIKREADRPLETTITIPSHKQGAGTGLPWKRHVIADEHGIYREDFRGWEAHVLKTELNQGGIAWYRNPSFGRGALAIPYTSTGGVSGCYPDFIFIDAVDGQPRASIIDPHGTHLADAVAKLKGIAEYASKHGLAFHRIQSIALVDDEYLMINHLDPIQRVAIQTFNGSESIELFRGLGARY